MRWLSSIYDVGKFADIFPRMLQKNYMLVFVVPYALWYELKKQRFFSKYNIKTKAALFVIKNKLKNYPETLLCRFQKRFESRHG